MSTLKLSDYAQTTDPHVISVVRRRYERTIGELSRLGFADGGVMTETGPRPSLVGNLSAVFGALLQGVFVQVTWPLRPVIYQAWMVHPDTSTYAVVFGYRVVLCTELSDGFGVLTANYTPFSASPKSRLDAYGMAIRLQELTDLHWARVQRRKSAGVNVAKEVSFERLVDLKSRADPSGLAAWVVLILDAAVTSGALLLILLAVLRRLTGT